ncbi:MAG TPA: LmeA family phospholipid-binding protein [Streptosporangiaceae bacterium]
MSSDPTQPVPEWWQQPQAPKKEQEAQKDRAPQNPQDSQATRQYPTSQGSPAKPTFTPSQGNQPDQGYPSGSGFPSGQGYQQDQDYPGNQEPPGAPTYPPNQGFPAAQGYQGPPARVRRRRRRWPWITLLVIVLVLVGADRAANAYAENQMASQVQSSLALSGKPNVTIQGFPFLTQVAARTFNTVDVNASNETAGTAGQLEIASLTATLHGMHIHGTNSATVDQFTASALVTFTALAHAGGIPQGITLAPAGPNQLKATVDILGFSTDATAKVTQVGSNKINVKITDFNGVPANVLGNLTDFTFSIPKLPAGVKIQSISVTQQGLRVTATGQNTTLSQ